MPNARRVPLILSAGLTALVAGSVLAGGALTGGQDKLLLAGGLALLAVLAVFTVYLWRSRQPAMQPAVQQVRSTLPPLPPAIGSRAPHGSEGSCCGQCQH